MTETIPPGSASPSEIGDSLVNPTAKTSIRSAFAVGAGTVIEWYDYGLYVYVAGLVIAPQFFPNSTGTAGLLIALATFAIGFLARPFGGIVLGSLADRYGRRPILMLSILLIGVATTLIGLTPSFATIGVWAPILLITFRLIQGFGAGAELGGAIIMVNESAQRSRKGFFSSFAMAGSGAGAMLALAIFFITSTAMGPEKFSEYGWRIPFLLSAVLTVIGFVLRSKLHESPEFEAIKAARKAGTEREPRRNPFVAFALAFRQSPRNWFAGFLLPSGQNVTGYVVAGFGVSYLVGTIHLPQNQALLVGLVSWIVMFLMTLVFGAISDKIGSRRVMFISIIGSVLWVTPYYLILGTGNLGLAILATSIMLALAYGAGAAALTVLTPAYFKAEYRSAGLFSSRELQGAIVSGPAPLLAAALFASWGGSWWGAAVVIIGAQILTLIGVFIARPYLTAQEKASTPAFAGTATRED